MLNIIVVNGMPQSGKTTFEDFCCQKLGPYGRKISTVDFVKSVARYCGWDGVKTPKDRKFLSDLKDLLSLWDDIPFKKIYGAICGFMNELEEFGDTKESFIFIDSREPAEIKRFKDELGAKTLLIRRPVVEEKEQSNHADKNVFNFEYDYEIVNDGDLDNLRQKAILFLEKFDKI